jgi:methylglyoxal synthase
MAAIVTVDEDRLPRPLAVVALIAHDAKKSDLLRLVRGNRPLLDGFRLLATRTTGHLIRDELELPIELLASGPMGGDLQIGARIVEERIDELIFLRDPLTAHPHQPDIQALLKVCDIHQVPVATNLVSAEILIRFLASRTQGPGALSSAAVRGIDSGGDGEWRTTES